MDLTMMACFECGDVYKRQVKEQYDPTDAHIGPQRALVLALTLVGLEGVCEPLIKTNKAMD